jgi:hypothetical protein
MQYCHLHSNNSGVFFTFVTKLINMTSAFFISIVIIGYVLVVGGLFVIEFIKSKRGGNTGGH